ncbi:MAG: pseudouridine synthase [Verrucomicrobiota bacterium JB022]|nr:pseudouridine synthase [Verrucomicrobiota bacterium JB022]
MDALQLLYRDDYLAAFTKPAGLMVHRSQLDTRETRFALQEARDFLGQIVYPVHRLDRATSGVLVFALDPESARSLVTAFSERQTQKRYLAIARGWLEAPVHLDYPLTKDGTGEPQPAVTDFRPRQQTEVAHPVGRYDTARYTLLEAEPHTGRYHQLRRHLGHLRHPIIGTPRTATAATTAFSATFSGTSASGCTPGSSPCPTRNAKSRWR